MREGGRDGKGRKRKKEWKGKRKGVGKRKRDATKQALFLSFAFPSCSCLFLLHACVLCPSIRPSFYSLHSPPIVPYSSIDHVPQPTVEGPSIQAGRSDARDGFVPLGMCFVSLFSTECPWLNCPFSHPSEQLKKEAVHSVGQFTDAVADTLSNR